MQADFKSAKVEYDESIPGNRRVLCKTAMKAGELVIEERLQLFALYSNHLSRACHFCLEETANAKRCSECKYAHYCSHEHQMADWKNGHKKECKIFKTMTGEGKKQPTAPLAIILKAFVQLEMMSNLGLKKNIEALKGHDDAMTPERHDELRDNVILVFKYSDGNFDLERIEHYVKILDRILINGVTVYSKSDAGDSLAMGLLKDFSRTNHSCEPNCFSAYNNLSMRIVTARPIQPGEEITFSYVDSLDRVENRRKKLKTEYFFDCSCAKCKRELESPAPKCPLTAEELNTQLETIEDCRKYVKLLETKLAPNDYEWYRGLERIEPVLASFRELEYLYEFRLRFTSKFEHWFGDCTLNPVVGQHYNNLGRLANQLGLVQETYTYCTKAIQIFKPYFTGPLMKELEEMAIDAKSYLEMHMKS
jgi:hypothetical protein